MYESGSWGGIDPDEKPKDTHRAYPQGHTDTLAPAVSQAIQGSRKPKIPQFKGLGKQLIIAGSVLGVLWLFSILTSLSSRQSVATPQLELEPAPEAVETVEPPPLSDLSSRRLIAWEEVKQLCGVNLQSVAQSTDENVREARADSWLIFAKVRCDQDKNCSSPYQWLNEQLIERGSRIQRIALADRLPVKAEQILEYRQAQSDLLDIAEALSSGVSARSLSWVPADELSDAIDKCSDAASRFESLTRAAVEDAQMFPGGDLNEPF